MIKSISAILDLHRGMYHNMFLNLVLHRLVWYQHYKHSPYVPLHHRVPGGPFDQYINVDLDKQPFVDIENELEMRGDGMWYTLGDGNLYTGLGLTFYANGQKKTRTKFLEGIPIGLIEEWDENGSLLGPRFKGEFNP